MKKVILVLLMVGSLFADLTQEEKDLSGRLVKVLGYRCDTVDNARRSVYDGSITVYCNGFSYSYELKNRGGRWQIEVK